MQKYGWIGFSVFMLNPLQLAAAMDAETFFRLPTVKLGIASGAGNTEVSKEAEFDDVAFNTSASISPVVTLIQPPAYFSEAGRWGYHTELSVAYFKLDYDDDKDSEFSSGDYEGYSVYFAPVLIYQWGNKSLCSNCKSWRIELGAGVNYLNSDGNLTRNNGDHVSFESTGFDINSHLGMMLNYKKWEFGWRLVMPTRIDDDNVKVRHAVSSLSLGYRF